MRKLSVSIISLVALLLFQGMNSFVCADNVDLKKAQSIGAYYLSMAKGVKSAPEDLCLVYQVTNQQKNIAAAYCFNNVDGGFVIVAGHDCATPIIGYSENNSLDGDNMPPSLVVWLEQYCEPIIDIQNSEIQVPTNEEWAALEEETMMPFFESKETIILLTDEWDQGDNDTPTYNAMCPQASNGQYAVVGCVATAMSEIMRYWQFPRKGQGSIFYPCSMADINVEFKKANYKYELMPNKLTTASSQDQIDATALLCYHAGAAMKMDYGIDGSGAVTYYNGTSYVANALKAYFKYPSCRTIFRQGRTNEAWVDTIKNEIMHHRPVLYCAADNDPSHGSDAAGHAFVCDGVRESQNKYHFNWGWGGLGNGFYDLINATTSFNPQNTYYNFNKKHEATINFAPPTDSIVGITTIVEDQLEEAYPNPATHSIVIAHEVKTSCTLTIYNIEGRVMDRIELKPEQGYVMVDVERYPAGVYFYKTTGKGHKFIVQ